MYSFLIRRLFPFFLVSILAEAIELIVMGIWKHNELDLSFLVMVKTSGVLLLTTLVSFFYIMLPYVLYLLFLPARFVNSSFDKSITIISYAVYTFFILGEELVSALLLEMQIKGFSLEDKNLAGYFYAYYQVIAAEYPVWLLGGGVFILSVLIVSGTSRYLFNELPVPKFGTRLYHTAIYVVICVLAYINIDINKLEISANQYNSRLAEEGSYNLIKAINEQEISPVLEKFTHGNK